MPHQHAPWPTCSRHGRTQARARLPRPARSASGRAARHALWQGVTAHDPMEQAGRDTRNMLE
ncbi:hypothetical protein RMHFA_05615 (plasmid) [Roseomonas mucosa]|nr:hypothetical protein RMP42_05615 [Roseomonas mucosa]UZO99231.1 hypothetical protein RMHFA_05615 [Roseomonas mucosa]